MFRSIGQSETGLIQSAIEILVDLSFAWCNSLTASRFESDSKLPQIEEAVFSWSESTSVSIPASVQMVNNDFVFDCGSLTSVTFEPTLKVSPIDE
jgi:hypothetical protein